MLPSIIMTYPGFKALPRAIKHLLLTSESYFFEDIRTRSSGPRNTTANPVKMTVPAAPQIKLPAWQLPPWSMN